MKHKAISHTVGTYPEDYNQWIQDIITARQSIEMTQHQLANLIGSHPPYICDLEAGRVKPTLTKLGQIASALGCRLVVRLERKEIMP